MLFWYLSAVIIMSCFYRCTLPFISVLLRNWLFHQECIILIKNYCEDIYNGTENSFEHSVKELWKVMYNGFCKNIMQHSFFNIDKNKKYHGKIFVSWPQKYDNIQYIMTFIIHIIHITVSQEV